MFRHDALHAAPQAHQEHAGQPGSQAAYLAPGFTPQGIGVIHNAANRKKAHQPDGDHAFPEHPDGEGKYEEQQGRLKVPELSIGQVAIYQ